MEQRRRGPAQKRRRVEKCPHPVLCSTCLPGVLRRVGKSMAAGSGWERLKRRFLHQPQHPALSYREARTYF